jgi:glycosyltransferase involved in cell wall biosynthesis
MTDKDTLNFANIGFISVQVDFWDNPWQNRHAFLWELANYCPVFFRSPPAYLVDVLQGRKRTKLSGSMEIKPNLYSYVPPRWLPYNYRFKLIDNLLRVARETLESKALRRVGFTEPILLIWHPNYYKEIGKHNERLVVYYKYDNYAGYYSSSPNKAVNSIDPEKIILERADLIFVTSKGLYDLHHQYHHKLHLVPNGVDYDFFYNISKNFNAIPQDLESIPSPRIGYIGVINEKVDFKLLTKICRSHRDWSIVLVGPEKTRASEFRENLIALQEQPNCYFLGQKEFREVPYYINGMDVCMMCYLINDWTYYGYPLKMHEYLACGKPSISADLPAVRDFSNVVKIAKNSDEWIVAIEAAIAGNGPGTTKERLDVASNNSWKARVEQSLNIISGHL